MKDTDKTETGVGKAQHSPLPWRTNGLYITPHDSSRDIAVVTFDGSRGGIELREANAKLIVASVNHAAKLAEALREVHAKLGEYEGKGDRRQGEIIILAWEKTREALAAYQGFAVANEEAQ